MLQVVEKGHDQVAYVFGILMVEYINLLVEVKKALVHMDKFITPSLADPMIRRWNHSVHYDVVLTLIRYEELGWGCQFFHLVQDLPQCMSPGCQALIYQNAWKSERWMTSCSRAC
jgi:hypothetical protein